MSARRPPHPVYGPAQAPVRLGNEQDLAACLAIDDGYTTGRVWQMDLHRPDDTLAGAALPLGDLDEPLGVIFRPVRLPRPLTVPGAAAHLAPAARLAHWRTAEALLVVGPRPPVLPSFEDPAESPADPAATFRPPAATLPEVWGYVLLGTDRGAGQAWVRALAVGAAHRGQGLGGRLLEAAKAWARAGVEEGGAGNLAGLLIALAPRNYPAITFCRRRGFRFCGYTDTTALGGEVQLCFVCPLRT
jgi:GNAT superfamily N-acetyltransferase